MVWNIWLTDDVYCIGVIYLTTVAAPLSVQRLEEALDALLAAATATGGSQPVCLYKLQYEQSLSSREPTSTTRGGVTTFAFPSPSLDLAFDDSCLESVKDAWKVVVRDDTPEDAYMVFEDREGVGDDDEVYD